MYSTSLLVSTRKILSVFCCVFLWCEIGVADDLIEQHRKLMKTAISECNTSRLAKLINTPYVEVDDKPSPGFNGTYLAHVVRAQNCSADDKLSMARVLLENDANPDGGLGPPGSTIVMEVATSMPGRAVEMTDMLLGQGLDNLRYDLGQGNNTMHFIAAWTPGAGRLSADQIVSIMDLMLKNRASITLTNDKRQTPLIYAAWHYADPKAAEFLLDHGADIDLADSCDMTAIDYAQITNAGPGPYLKFSPDFRAKNPGIVSKADALFETLKKRGAKVRELPDVVRLNCN